MTLNSCEDVQAYFNQVFIAIYTRFCLVEDVLDAVSAAAAPATVAVGTLAAGALWAMPPLPMTLASGIPPGMSLLINSVDFYSMSDSG